MAEDLRQPDMRALFEEQGEGPWTVLNDSSWEDGRNHGIYCALSEPSRRAEALESDSWCLTVTDGGPGFMQSYSGGGPVTTYLRVASASDGVEPLVLVREFHGAAESTVELDQQFRLFHNMFYDLSTNTYLKMHDDGNRTIAVKFDGTRLLVRTAYIKQYIAARQMDLLLFIDSKAWSVDPPASTNSEEFRTETYSARVDYMDRRPLSGNRYGSRYLATKVIPAGPVETCGIWPYEVGDDHYPEFIIGEDEYGQPQKFTCDPDKLANYFDANPDAPHYLTPVHFRREVLAKYYDNPERYEVTDGRLSCASLWAMQIDNDHADRVVVFLGDLGRDLPASERDYWRGYMIAPDAAISETNMRRSFFSQATNPESVDLRFRRAYRDLVTSWSQIKGWRLFREPKEADVYLLQQLRMPLNDSQNEFEEAVKLLAKLMSDALNERMIQAQLPSKIDDEKGISKLERYLTQEGYPLLERDIAYLRRVQNLRSKVSAHLKGSDYEKVLTKNLGDARGVEAVRGLLEDGLKFLESLLTWLNTEVAD